MLTKAFTSLILLFVCVGGVYLSFSVYLFAIDQKCNKHKHSFIPGLLPPKLNRLMENQQTSPNTSRLRQRWLTTPSLRPCFRNTKITNNSIQVPTYKGKYDIQEKCAARSFMFLIYASTLSQFHKFIKWMWSSSDHSLLGEFDETLLIASLTFDFKTLVSWQSTNFI